MSKILILGGAGFLGYHLAIKLHSEDNEVHLVDNFSRGVNDKFFKKLIQNKNINYFNRDLLDFKSLDELDVDYNYIYNFSAIIGVKHVLSSPFEVLTKNFVMMQNAINFAKQQKNLNQFIFASTSEVVAGSLQYLDLNFPTPEDFPLALTDVKHPRTSYMLSKIYGEAMCHHSDLPFIIIRPHNIYGTRMGLSHVIPEVMFKIYKLNYSESLQIFNPKHHRAFCYVDDAVNMIVSLSLSKSKINDVINIGNPNEEISVENLVKLIAKTMNREDVEFNFKNEDNSGSPLRRVPCMNKFNIYSKYSSTVSLNSGCKKIFDWYKNNIFSDKVISSN